MCLYDRRGKKNTTDVWGKHSSWHHKFNGFTIQKVVFQWNLGELLWCTIGLPQILQKFPGHKKDGAVDSFPDYSFFFIGCVLKLQGHEKVRESIADGVVVATMFPINHGWLPFGWWIDDKPLCWKKRWVTKKKQRIWNMLCFPGLPGVCDFI